MFPGVAVGFAEHRVEDGAHDEGGDGVAYAHHVVRRDGFGQVFDDYEGGSPDGGGYE